MIDPIRTVAVVGGVAAFRSALAHGGARARSPQEALATSDPTWEAIRRGQ